MQPLIFGIVTSFFLYFIRWFATGDEYFFFLPYNLALALIPLLLAWGIVRYSGHKARSWLLLVAAGFVWLMFFPNAPYIITDFIHLAPRGGIPIWFDFMLILSFAASGLLAGWYSLYFMQTLFRRWFDELVSWVFVLVSLMLASFGVSIGRFLRWNSWDLFLDPIGLATDVFGRLFTPSLYPRFWIFSGLLVGFFVVSYGSFIIFQRSQKDRMG